MLKISFSLETISSRRKKKKPTTIICGVSSLRKGKKGSKLRYTWKNESHLAPHRLHKSSCVLNSCDLVWFWSSAGAGDRPEVEKAGREVVVEWEAKAWGLEETSQMNGGRGEFPWDVNAGTGIKEFKIFTDNCLEAFWHEYKLHFHIFNRTDPLYMAEPPWPVHRRGQREIRGGEETGVERRNGEGKERKETWNTQTEGERDTHKGGCEGKKKILRKRQVKMPTCNWEPGPNRKEQKRGGSGSLETRFSFSCLNLVFQSCSG